MSLLIDALRKAEADRQRAAGVESATPPEVSEALSLEPIDLETAELPPAAPRPAVNEPPRGQRPQRPASTAPRPGTAPVGNAAGAAAARNMFASKRPQRPPISLTTWALGIGLCIAAVGSTYVWYEIQPRGIQMGPAIARPGTLQPEPSASVPQAQDPTPIATAQAAPQAAEPRETEPAPEPRPRPHRPTGANAEPASDDAPVVRRGAVKSANPAANEIDAGYAAYERGDLDAAREHYLVALRSDSRAADALNGLGAVALQGGRPEDAERWFRQALNNNPADPVAQAGLVSLGRESDPVATESRLKGAIARDPDVAASHFSLGTLEAQSGRWADAQQSFFRAYSLEPDNPDYRFNLAVALDHLNQSSLAAQYYGLALTAAAQRPAHFDRDAASRRLKALTPP
jgi:tetratricopeptide (TPR) repeat protein